MLPVLADQTYAEHMLCNKKRGGTLFIKKKISDYEVQATTTTLGKPVTIYTAISLWVTQASFWFVRFSGSYHHCWCWGVHHSNYPRNKEGLAEK
jgi:hypothetical protein